MGNGGRKKCLFCSCALGLALAAAVIAGIALSRAGRRAPTEVVFPGEAEIRAAIDYGLEHKDDFISDFIEPWHVSLGYGRGLGSATVYTPWLNLAIFSRNAALGGVRIDERSLVSLARQESGTVRFETVLYGDGFGFTRDFRALVVAGEEEFSSLRKVSRGYDQAREYTIIARNDFHFPPRILKERGEIILRIIRPEVETPLDFPFDLDRIR